MRGRTWIAAATAAGVVASLGLAVAGGNAGAQTTTGTITPGPVVSNGVLILKNAGTAKKPATSSSVTWYKSGTTSWSGGYDPTSAAATVQVLSGPASGTKCVMTSNAVNGTSKPPGYPYLTFDNPAPTTQVPGAVPYVGYQPGYMGVDSIVGTDNSGQACQQVGDPTASETLSIQANNTASSGVGQSNGKNYFSQVGLDVNVAGNVIIVAHFYKDGVEIGRLEYQTGTSVNAQPVYSGDATLPFCNYGVSNSGPQNVYGSECFWEIAPLGYGTTAAPGVGLLADPGTSPAPGYNLFDRIDLEAAGPKGGDFSVAGGNSFTDPKYAALGSASYFTLAQQFPYGAGCGDYGTTTIPIGATGGFASVSYKRLQDYDSAGGCATKYFAVTLDSNQLRFITDNSDPYAAWQFTYERDYPDGTKSGPPSMLSIDFTNTGTDFRSLGYCPSSGFSYPDGSAGAPTWSSYNGTTNAWSYTPTPVQPTFLSLSALQALDWYPAPATGPDPHPGVQYACTYAQSQENVTIGGVRYQRFLDWTLLYGDLLTRGG